MKKLLTILITIVLTVVFLFIILLSYVLIKNPLGIGSLIKSQIFNVESNSSDDASLDSEEATYDHPLLSTEQEKRLIEAGIDLKKIPEEISVEQKKCALDKVNEERIKEIIAGAKPTPLEVIKVIPCLNK